MNNLINTTAGLFLLALVACSKSETEQKPQTKKELPVSAERKIEKPAARPLNLTPMRIRRDDKQYPIGLGTMVIDGDDRYLVTARHLFTTKAVFTAEADTLRYNISALEGDEESDLVVGIFGPVPHQLGPLVNKLTPRLEAVVTKGGNFDFVITKEQRVFLTNGEVLRSVAKWPKFERQRIECFDCWLGHGSSGGGFIADNGRNDLFWVVSGEWPPTITEAFRFESMQPDFKGFTLVTGATWEEINRWYQNLKMRK